LRWRKLGSNPDGHTALVFQSDCGRWVVKVSVAQFRVRLQPTYGIQEAPDIAHPKLWFGVNPTGEISPDTVTLGAIRFDPMAMIGAISAVIGGTVVFGSNTSTLKQAAVAIKTAEALRGRADR
jgi:hypothetical protein